MVVIRSISISHAGGQCETKLLSWTRKRVVAARYRKYDLLTVGLAVRIFPATTRTLTKDTALSEYGRGMAWALHGLCELTARHGRGTAWARHGVCELTARHGRGTAWARHAMCESALRQYSMQILQCVLSGNKMRRVFASAATCFASF